MGVDTQRQPDIAVPGQRLSNLGKQEIFRTDGVFRRKPGVELLGQVRMQYLRVLAATFAERGLNRGRRRGPLPFGRQLLTRYNGGELRGHYGDRNHLPAH